jgi:hypothetical protein
MQKLLSEGGIRLSQNGNRSSIPRRAKYPKIPD